MIKFKKIAQSLKDVMVVQMNTTPGDFTEKISRKPLALAYGGIETFFFEKEGTSTSMYEYKLGVSGCLLKKSF